MNKTILATLATISLAFAGVVSGVAPAHAAYSPDDALRSIQLKRTGAPAIIANAIVASTTLSANEVLMDFSFSADFASTLSPLVVTAGQVLDSVVVATNTTANSTVSGYDSNPALSWTKTDNTTGTWTDGGPNAFPTGTFKKFEVSSSKYLNVTAAASYSASATVTLAGTVLTPLTLASGSDFYSTPGFNIDWVGGPSYTPSSADAIYSAYSTGCFWQSDFTVTPTSVLHVSYDNLDSTTNTGFATNNNVDVSGNTGAGMNGYWNGQEVPSGEVFDISLSALPTTIDAVAIRAYSNVTAPTANAIRPVFKAWLDDATSVNVLSDCSRYESFAAPTLTPATATTATLTWDAPVTAHSANWDSIAVYACLTTNTNCGTSAKDPWDMAPGETFTYDFLFMGPIATRQVTLSAMTMRSAAMMMGPTSGPPATWSPSTSYKYFVFYRQMSLQNGFKGLSSVSPAAIGGLGVVADPDEEEVVVESVTAVSVPTPIKNFAPHKVAASAQKNFTLDGSGLAADASITVNGKKIAFTKDAAGKIQIELPKGLKRGASYNLVVSDSNGSFTLLDAIVVSKDLPISKKVLPGFNGRATDMSATQVREIRALVAASNFGDTVTCTAYFGGATTEATATARATSACATATAANPALTAVIRTAKAIAASRNTVRVVIG
jgi:hypothetical protein